jgi:hypothetical protein
MKINRIPAVLFFTLLAGCAPSSADQIEKACQLVQDTFSKMPPYPTHGTIDDKWRRMQADLDVWWEFTAPKKAEQMREAAEIFRSLASENDSMANFAIAANITADELESKAKYFQADKYGELRDFCN